jgi:hypothetical protein
VVLGVDGALCDGESSTHCPVKAGTLEELGTLRTNEGEVCWALVTFLGEYTGTDFLDSWDFLIGTLLSWSLGDKEEEEELGDAGDERLTLDREWFLLCLCFVVDDDDDDDDDDGTLVAPLDDP